MPGAIASGVLETSPIKRQPTPAARHVPIATAPTGMPASPMISGLTTTM